jgi:hypothetical protein
MLIERWFQVTPAHILEAEIDPSTLDDAPIVTVQGILPTRRRGGGKVSGLRGGSATVVSHSNIINVHFGRIMENFFGSRTVDDDMLCYVKSEMSELAMPEVADPNPNIPDASLFGHPGIIHLHECSDFAICPRQEVGPDNSWCFPQCFFTVGITWDEWVEREEPLFGDYVPFGEELDETKESPELTPCSWEDIIGRFKAHCLGTFAGVALSGPVLVGV